MTKQVERLYDSLLQLAWSFNTYCCDSEEFGEFTLIDFLALRIIDQQKDCPIQTLSKHLCVTKSGATRVVKRLEKRSLVTINNSTSDGRVRCLRLSKEGLQSLTKIQEMHCGKIQASLKHLNTEQSQLLESSLTDLQQTLQSNECSAS